MNRKVIGIKLCRKAGKLLLSFYYKTNIEIPKGKKDFFLDADLKAEKLILGTLKKCFPQDSILSEEKGQIKGNSIYKWITDPLDGTANFKAKIPYFCVTMCLEKNNRPIMAIVYEPINNNLYFAEKNKGAFLNGKRIKVSSTKNLDKFLISYSTSNHKNKKVIDLGARCFKKILMRCRLIRLEGSSILDFCNLSKGIFDGLIKVGANYWDFAAGCLILEEAGGIATDLNGNGWGSKTQNLIASNKIRHNDFIRILGNKK